MKNLKFWQTKKFKELEKQWYERLKDIGFTDEEKLLNGHSVLKQRTSNCYRSAAAVEREAKSAYYTALAFYTGEQAFRDGVERLIMERRAHGKKIKEISIELRSLNQRCHRETIRLVIQKYEIQWGMRKRK